LFAPGTESPQLPLKKMLIADRGDADAAAVV